MDYADAVGDLLPKRMPKYWAPMIEKLICVKACVHAPGHGLPVSCATPQPNAVYAVLVCAACLIGHRIVGQAIFWHTFVNLFRLHLPAAGVCSRTCGALVVVLWCQQTGNCVPHDLLAPFVFCLHAFLSV